MLGKIIDCESLDISQENFCDGVSFSKLTNLQCLDWHVIIKKSPKILFGICTKKLTERMKRE